MKISSFVVDVFKSKFKVGGRKTMSAKDYLAKKILPISFTADLTENIYDLDKSVDCLEKIPGALDPIVGRALLGLSAYAPGIEPVIEVGSYLGRSTSYLALGSKIASKKGVYAIDMFPGVDDWYLGSDGYYHIHGSNYYLTKEVYNERSSFIYKEGGYQNMLELFKEIIKKVGLGDMVIPYRGTSSEFAQSVTTDSKFRMIFIDGDHTYEGVTQDIFSLVNLLREDGIICFHDYSENFPGVIKAVNKHIISSPDFSDFSLVGSLLIAKKHKKGV
ncbi:class I SAM-dependent methyltransferase [candidate division WOR-3 bacterium]|nr:class I SAM-dependent methyltransferase [candidate division WOR-3 bacterium]